MAELVWKQAREAARKVLDGNWDQQVPVKIEQICRACGVTTYKCIMPDDLSGMIVKRAAERDAKAFIDKEEPGVRQRFTLAHELGHFIERTVIAQDDEYGFEEVRMGGRRERTTSRTSSSPTNSPARFSCQNQRSRNSNPPARTWQQWRNCSMCQSVP